MFSGSFQLFLLRVALSFLIAQKRAALCLHCLGVRHARLVSENCDRFKCPYLTAVWQLNRFQRLHQSAFGAASLLATIDVCSALKVSRLIDDLSH